MTRGAEGSDTFISIGTGEWFCPECPMTASKLLHLDVSFSSTKKVESTSMKLLETHRLKSPFKELNIITVGPLLRLHSNVCEYSSRGSLASSQDE